MSEDFWNSAMCRPVAYIYSLTLPRSTISIHPTHVVSLNRCVDLLMMLDGHLRHRINFCQAKAGLSKMPHFCKRPEVGGLLKPDPLQQVAASMGANSTSHPVVEKAKTRSPVMPCGHGMPWL